MYIYFMFYFQKVLISLFKIYPSTCLISDRGACIFHLSCRSFSEQKKNQYSGGGHLNRQSKHSKSDEGKNQDRTGGIEEECCAERGAFLAAEGQNRRRLPKFGTGRWILECDCVHWNGGTDAQHGDQQALRIILPAIEQCGGGDIRRTHSLGRLLSLLLQIGQH